jgi:phosphinothricin acetyltransferase
MDLTITPLVPDDWPAVRAVYLDGIATGQATFETGAPDWPAWDAGKLPHSRLIARVGQDVAGWAALAPTSPRPAYAGVAEVSVYVAAAHRGRGVGTALLQALIAEAERHGVRTLQGATFPENAASLRLQAACGFRVVGRRERVGQLGGAWRDTILTERRSRVVEAAGAAPRLVGAVPVLPALDLAAAVAFYESKLGFRGQAHTADYAVLARDDIQIHLWKCDDPGWPRTSGCRVQVTHVERLYEEYRAAGVVHPNGPPAVNPSGFREFVALDRDGNRLTFAEPAADSQAPPSARRGPPVTGPAASGA